LLAEAMKAVQGARGEMPDRAARQQGGPPFEVLLPNRL
jgi:hypothetical protein